MKSFKKYVVLLMALSMFAFLGFGCDTGSSGGVCTQTTVVTGTQSAKLFYPCNLSQPVGATTVMSGFLGTKESVAWLARSIAQNGFVALSLTPLNQYGMVSGWNTAHRGGVKKLQQLASSGKLAGKIDTSKLGVCGHSKGGGGALWAGSNNSAVSSVIGMAPYNGYPGTYEGPAPAVIGRISAPTYIQAGSMDTLATNVMTRGEFQALGNIDKCYKTFPVDHMGWVYNNPQLSNGVVSWLNYVWRDGPRPSCN